MTKRPTPPPLTATERAALYDLITRAARALPTDGDCKRLLRLRELDHADRKQERRSAGGTERTNNILKGQVEVAQAKLAAVRELAGELEEDASSADGGLADGQWDAAERILLILDDPDAP
jgi:hypothetical protein